MNDFEKQEEENIFKDTKLEESFLEEKTTENY